MKKTMACLLSLWLLFSCVGLAETVYGVSGEPYYHLSANCEYGISSFYRVEPARKGTLKQAAACNMRACPSCASEWKPYFTANFPDWTQDVKPWEFGSAFGSAQRVSDSLLKAWGGNAAQKIDRLVPDSSCGILDTRHYPSDYAGVFANASGCYTVLMVNPTPERAKEYSKTLGCEFWVLSADYSMNTLIALNNAVSLLNESDRDDVLKIKGFGIDVMSNRVEISMTDTSDKCVGNLYKCIEALGYSRDMIRVQKVSDLTEWDFGF